ncbi:NucA/NucB deoxyribonuclease domain-containing protein [Demequina zhanjiangensis]|uniref:NucA/NucB deoxyribonuclease domain-containing protein n=1 Tax=Demequina zhanjiangensis TaxID=3051659 RepID=UPI00345E7202
MDRGGSYSYDAGGRLTGVSTDGGDSASFSLDASGDTTLTKSETQSRSWCRSEPRCAGAAGDELSCDEYPSASTAEGGPGASIRWVPGREQSKPGGFMAGFYSACGSVAGDRFVVAPMPSAPTITFVCNK